MSKRKTPGLNKSKGMQTGFPTFPAGQYLVKIAEWKEKESSKGTSTIHSLRLECLDAYNDAQENQEMVGKAMYHRLIEMHDDHESFADWGHIFVDELKSIHDATGVAVSKTDGWDPANLVGTEAVVTLRVKEDQDDEGNPRSVNSVSKWEAVDAAE